MINLNIPQVIGRATLTLLQTFGRFGIFLYYAITAMLSRPFYIRPLLKQLVEVGYYSLPVIGLTAIFTGAVLALQTYTGFVRFNAESAIASVVALSITRELAPVLAGLMLAGRVSAAIAAEIGSMKVTEQIDALYTLSTDPFKYLVVPRIIAGLVTLPLLVLIADIIGIFGGYLVAVWKLDFSAYYYLSNTWKFLEFKDVMSGLIKAVVFGFIVCVMGCYCGMHSRGGAQGVGYATTTAVVNASILILLSNYIITGILFVR